MQTKDVREKILNFMREESYAPMTSEELVDALGHDVNPNKFWDELLALEQTDMTRLFVPKTGTALL